MSNSSKVRIGFCGVGGMGQMAHLRNYASLRDDCDVVALAEIRPKLAKRVSEKFGVPRIYPSHEAMLKEEKLDAILEGPGLCELADALIAEDEAERLAGLEEA